VYFGFNFRGQRIVRATVDTLAAGNGLGAAPGSRIVFGGCSAGARGAMFNLDYVAEYAPAGTQVLGFLDSAFWVDVMPLQNNIIPLANETQALLPLVNATGRLGPLCAAAYPEEEEQWKCLFGQYRMPYITTPFLLSASQFDKYQLPYNEGGAPPYLGQSLSYADAFQTVVRDLVLNLPTPNQPGSAMFSSACFKHCTSNVPEFWGVKVNGLSLKDYLVAWLAGEVDAKGQAVAQNIESCTGFGCGACDARRDAPGRAPEPPLPPAHTADLSLSAAGVGMVRYMPPPPAPPGAPGLLVAVGGRPSRRAGPSRADSSAGSSPGVVSRSFSGMAIGLGALCLGVLACCCCELLVAARRNYRTPPLPRSDLGGAELGSVGDDGGSGAGAGGICGGAPRSAAGKRSGGKGDSERRSKSASGGDKNDGLKSDSAKKVAAAWRAARGGVPATEMERQRLFVPSSAPIAPPAPPPRPAPVAPPSPTTQPPAPPPRAVLAPQPAAAAAEADETAGPELSKTERIAARRVERAAVKAAAAAAFDAQAPAAAGGAGRRAQQPPWAGTAAPAAPQRAAGGYGSGRGSGDDSDGGGRARGSQRPVVRTSFAD
jgi:hypothetical protein